MYCCRPRRARTFVHWTGSRRHQPGSPSWTLHGQARRNSQGTRNEIDLPLAARGHSAPSAERPWPYGHVLWAEDRHSGPTPGQRMEEDIENVPIGAEATRHGELGSYP